MVAHVVMEVGEEKHLRHFHHGLVGARFGHTVFGFLVVGELVAFVILLGAEFQSHVRKDAEHGVIAGEGETVHRIDQRPGHVTGRGEEAVQESGATVNACHPIIVGLGGFDIHAVQVGVGHLLGEREELGIDIYLGMDRQAAGQQGGHKGKEALSHRNISSISTVHTISARSSTLIRNLSSTLKKRTFSG